MNILREETSDLCLSLNVRNNKERFSHKKTLKYKVGLLESHNTISQ